MCLIKCEQLKCVSLLGESLGSSMGIAKIFFSCDSDCGDYEDHEMDPLSA